MSAARLISSAAPWLVQGELRIRLGLSDPALLGSERHFIRLDLYPLHSPSVHRRHHGYWDLPLSAVREAQIELTLDRKGLRLGEGRDQRRRKAQWHSGRDWNGYCVLHVSLWDADTSPPRQLEVVSSQHVVLPPGGDVELEQIVYPVTERCNLDCTFCRRRPSPGAEMAHLSEEVFAAVLDGARRVHSVHAMFLGEPLLNPGLHDMLARLRKRLASGGTLGLCTNAALLDAAHAARLLEAGPDHLFFHLDAATAATAGRIRRGLDFEAAVRNIGAFTRQRRERGLSRPWLTANFVIFEQNRDEAPAFVELAGRMGLDAVRLALYRDDHTQKFVGLDPEMLGPLFRNAQEIARKNGVALLSPNLARSPEPRCRFMQTVYILPSGDVVPCCRWQPSCAAFPREPRVFGNVRSTSIHDIWSSPDYRQFRRSILTGNLPESCRGCDLVTGLLA